MVLQSLSKIACHTHQLSSLYSARKDFFKVSLADERMFAVIALVCKKWSLFINEKFVERVHYAWLDREYDAQS